MQDDGEAPTRCRGGSAGRGRDIQDFGQHCRIRSAVRLQGQAMSSRFILGFARKAKLPANVPRIERQREFLADPLGLGRVDEPGAGPGRATGRDSRGLRRRRRRAKRYG